MLKSLAVRSKGKKRGSDCNLTGYAGIKSNKEFMITALVQNREKFYPATNNRAGHSAEALLRAAGPEVFHFTIGASSLGKVLVATSEKGVCAVLLGGEDKSLIADLKSR